MIEEDMITTFLPAAAATASSMTTASLAISLLALHNGSDSDPAGRITYYVELWGNGPQQEP